MKDATRVALVVSLILGVFTLTALAIPGAIDSAHQYLIWLGYLN